MTRPANNDDNYLTVAQAAERYGLTRDVAQRRARRSSMERRGVRGKYRYPPTAFGTRRGDDDAAPAPLADDGYLTVAQAAERYGIKASTLYTRVYDSGAPRRGVHGSYRYAPAAFRRQCDPELLPVAPATCHVCGQARRLTNGACPPCNAEGLARHLPLPPRR